MKVIVFSDSHGDLANLLKVVKKHQDDADMFIHLGDGEREFTTLTTLFPSLKMYHIAGNCDYDSLHPSELILGADYNIKIFATHGHRYYVKYSLEAIKSSARENGCQIALYGHTHQRYNAYEDGLYILNPSSISCPRDSYKPSYGVIDISKPGIMTNIVDV
jgi:hypothetical protein